MITKEIDKPILDKLNLNLNHDYNRDRFTYARETEPELEP